MDRRKVSEKAIRIAVRTGWTPDVDLIWETQEAGGGSACFGCFAPTCPRDCRWWRQCKVLSDEAIKFPFPGADTPHPAQ